MMSNILEQCIRIFTNLFREQVLQNISFHSQSSYIELSSGSTTREEKFPAVIMRGPFLKEDKFFRELDDKLDRDIEKLTYKKTFAPKVYDVVYKILIISEGDIEGLNTISKVITFFAVNNQLNINGKIYNIELIEVPEDSLTSNISDLSRYEGKFLIEGIEFDTGYEDGRLVSAVETNINNF